MKKLVVYLLSIIICLSIFKGCVNSNGTKNSSEGSASSQSSQGSTDNTIRETSFGPVQGYKDNKSNVYIWKGIPYAKAPVGNLRWKAPQDPDKWTKTYDATKSGQIGIQYTSGKTVGSEDCLNLDVYSPDTEDKDLPVIVYIHGGNNQTGQSSEIDGRTLANDSKCIFVSLNYRLGVLGFNCLPALRTGNSEEDSGNYSLLDIAKALDWVKSNISVFGGNADNITVSGFSAGGRDVMAMLISPIFKGKFNKAISFSGGMTTSDISDSTAVIAKALAPFVVEDKVKATTNEAAEWLQSSDESVKTYLYGLSAERLTTVMQNAGIRMSAFPHLFRDGTVLPKEGFDTKNYNSVDLLMLTGTSEFSLFAAGDPYFSASYKDGTLFTNSTKHSEYLFAKKYGSLLYELFNAQESAQKMCSNYKAKIYNCTVTYGENASVVGTAMANFGAFHGVFVPLIDKNNATYQNFLAAEFGKLWIIS